MSTQQSSQVIRPGEEHVVEELEKEKGTYPCPADAQEDYARTQDEAPSALSLK